MKIRLTMTASYELKQEEFLRLFSTEDEDKILAEIKESFTDDPEFAGAFMVNQPDFILTCEREQE